MAGILKANIDVTKIPKDKLYHGVMGKYLQIAISVNDIVDKFGNHGPVTVDQTKEERDNKDPKKNLGNVQCVWTNGKPLPEPQKDTAAYIKQEVLGKKAESSTEDDLPF